MIISTYNLPATTARDSNLKYKETYLYKLHAQGRESDRLGLIKGIKSAT